MQSDISTQSNLVSARKNEAAVVGACLRDGGIYPRVRELLSPEDFSWDCYRHAVEAMESLFSQNMGIDQITVGDELERMGKLTTFVVDESMEVSLRGGRNGLSHLRDTGTPKNLMTYADNVKDYAAKRKILQFLNTGAGWALNGRRASAIVADLTRAFSSLTTSIGDDYTVPISTAVSEAYDWTEMASQGKIKGVKTGLYDLDRILGSLIAGNVYIAAARPKVGKTGFLLTIARNAALKGKKICIFSLEMSRMQVAQRLIAQEAQIDLQGIMLGKMSEKEWEAHTQAVEKVAALPISINDLSGINIDQVRQTARAIASTQGIDLIIFDYIQLASASSRKKEKNATRELEVSEVSRGLKYMARELNVPILAAAQLNRSVEQRADKRPILSDLRESGSLEQDAYAVIFLNRDPYDRSSAEQAKVDISVAAHRNGPVGDIEATLIKKYVRFESASTRDYHDREEV